MREILGMTEMFCTWVVCRHEISLNLCGGTVHFTVCKLYIKKHLNPDVSAFKIEKCIPAFSVSWGVRKVYDSVPMTIIKEKLAAILNIIWTWLKMVDVTDLPSNESSMWEATQSPVEPECFCQERWARFLWADSYRWEGAKPGVQSADPGESTNHNRHAAPPWLDGACGQLGWSRTGLRLF